MPANDNYFRHFVEMTEYSCQTIAELIRTLSAFDEATLSQKMRDIHKIEHAADEKRHQMMEILVKDFITPLEREDISTLAKNIDDVTDNIEDVLMKIYMYKVTSIRPDTLEFLSVIEQCCKEMRSILTEFSNFKKSKTIHKSIIELNRLEETGDRLYVDVVRRLYEESANPVEIMAWTAVYSQMEKCCDACEEVANAVEEVIMKNS